MNIKQVFVLNGESLNILYGVLDLIKIYMSGYELLGFIWLFNNLIIWAGISYINDYLNDIPFLTKFRNKHFVLTIVCIVSSMIIIIWLLKAEHK